MRVASIMFLLASVLLLAAPSVTGAGTDACVNCHGDPAFRVTNRKLFDYFAQWTQSGHAAAGVICSDCHGGVGDVTDGSKETAHRGVFLPSDRKSEVYFRKLPATCGRCHQAEFAQFASSKHFLELQGDGDAPHCATCHGSMNSQVFFTSIVDSTCRTCHEDESSDELAARARSVLQSTKVARAYLRWTTLYYDGKGQADRAEALTARYREVAAAWHRFDLEQSEVDSAALLRELEGAFRAAWADEHPGEPLP